MYQYNDFDTAFIAERNRQFRAQVERRVAGHLTEDEFKPLRLMNGLYLQLHAYMLRVAVPYGSLDPARMRQLAYLADRWDKGYGHFTTRTNIQYNWPKLRDIPDMLDALAEVDMHAIQTSGNTIRNVTSDHFAGAAPDELEDPRPVAELIRQWSTDHPEFQFLPRKFKIAVIASDSDRAVMKSHDIGVKIVERDGTRGYEIWIGGGMGRTPMVAKLLKDFVPRADLLTYLESILATYNRLGRRDNKYKARIKITVHENGLDEIRDLVEAEFPRRRAAFSGVDQAWLDRINAAFVTPTLPERDAHAYYAARDADPVFRAWADTNIVPHKHADHGIVTIRLTAHGATRLPIRCVWWPIWPSATATMTSAPAMRRTSCCRMWRWLTSPPCMRHTARRGWPPAISASPRISSPAPAWITARSRPPVRSPWPKASPPGWTRSRSSMTWAISRSKSRAASMPAGITTSAISAFSGSTARGWKTTRSHSAAMPRKARPSAPAPDRALPMTRSCPPSSV